MLSLPRLAILALAFAALAAAPATAKTTKPTVVLVHGAFADASGWYGVQEQLEDKGYKVISPRQPAARRLRRRRLPQELPDARSPGRSCSSATPTAAS